MKIAKAHCFFEQSGTFRDEFIKLGIPAEDYDIDNHFGKTDHVIDLFGEINDAYGGGASVFDKVEKDDLIMAFFPCVRFSKLTKLHLLAVSPQEKNLSDEEKLQVTMKYHQELNELYQLISKMAYVVLHRGLRMVIENPASQPHYLTQYWPLKPSVVDNDRTKNGDYYKKPTQYWFLNCKSEQNFVFEALEYCEPRRIGFVTKQGDTDRKILRSMIHPQYARRFIKMYLLDQKEVCA